MRTVNKNLEQLIRTCIWVKVQRHARDLRGTVIETRNSKQELVRGLRFRDVREIYKGVKHRVACEDCYRNKEP